MCILKKNMKLFYLKSLKKATWISMTEHTKKKSESAAAPSASDAALFGRLPAHRAVRIMARYYFIDAWEAMVGTMRLDRDARRRRVGGLVGDVRELLGEVL